MFKSWMSSFGVTQKLVTILCISKNFKPIMDSYIHSFIFMQDDIPLFIVGAQSRVFQPLEERMEVQGTVNKVRLKKKRSEWIDF